MACTGRPKDTTLMEETQGIKDKEPEVPTHTHTKKKKKNSKSFLETKDQKYNFFPFQRKNYFKEIKTTNQSTQEVSKHVVL